MNYRTEAEKTEKENQTKIILFRVISRNGEEIGTLRALQSNRRLCPDEPPYIFFPGKSTSRYWATIFKAESREKMNDYLVEIAGEGYTAKKHNEIILPW
jgi:hypothetical protein